MSRLLRGTYHSIFINTTSISPYCFSYVILHFLPTELVLYRIQSLVRVGAYSLQCFLKFFLIGG